MGLPPGLLAGCLCGLLGGRRGAPGLLQRRLQLGGPPPQHLDGVLRGAGLPAQGLRLDGLRLAARAGHGRLHLSQPEGVDAQLGLVTGDRQRLVPLRDPHERRLQHRRHLLR